MLARCEQTLCNGRPEHAHFGIPRSMQHCATWKEYMKKDLALRAQVDNEEEELGITIQVEEPKEDKEDLTLPLQLFGGKKVRPRTTLRGNQIPTPVREVPQVVLDEGALARVEEAVASGEIVDIDERQFAPTRPIWEIPREGQAEKFWTPLPQELQMCSAEKNLKS